MKVLIYSRPFFPERAGVPFATHMMAKAIENAGHEAVIYTETPGSDQDVPDVSTYRVVRSTSPLILANVCHSTDLVLANGGISRKASLGAWITRKPLILVYQMARKSCRQRSWGHELLRRSIINYADLHIGVSVACLKSQRLPESVRKKVIYNPVDPYLEKLSNEYMYEEEIDILFAGRIIEGKGIFVLAEALKKFEEQGASLTVCFAGDGADRDRLQSIVRRFESVHVTLPGMLDRAQLAEVYSSAKCLVIPTSTHPEGMGIVIAEAFAFGLPVIGSNQAVIEEVVGDAGLIFENGNDDELFEKLKRVLDEDSLREDLSRKALRRGELFSFEHFARKINFAVEMIAG